MPILMRLGILILTLALAGCGEGYAIEPGRINLLNATQGSKATLTREVSAILVRGGFEDLGRDDEMIALLKSSPDTTDDVLLQRLYREHTFLNEPRGLRVVLSDHSDAAPSPGVAYTPKTPNFIEIAVYESRPGGGSPAGHRFFARFYAELKARFGEDIVVVNDLPPTNAAEFRRVTNANRRATVLSWCAAFLISFLITAPVTRFLIGRTKLARLPKRAVFTVVNAWLVAPVMFPVTITAVMLPNAFAFPWLYAEIYSFQARFFATSLTCALVLCGLASLLFIRDAGKPQAPT